MANPFDRFDKAETPQNQFDKFDKAQGTPRRSTGNAYLDFVTRSGTPMGELANYFRRVGDSAVGGIERAAQGIGDTIEGNVTRGASKGNVLTGIPRMALGVVQTAASPITGAIGPLIEPAIRPVYDLANEAAGQPIEDLTGYPKDITNDAVMQILTMGMAKGTRGALPKTTPERARLAQTLTNEGVAVYPGQLASNPMVNNALDLAHQYSIYDNGAVAAQADQIANAQARTMGQQGPDLRTAVANARNELGGIVDPQNPLGPKIQPGVYDQVYGRIGTHSVDRVANTELLRLQRQSASLDKSTQTKINGAIANIRSAISPNGQLTISAYKSLTDQGGALSVLEGSSNPAVALYGTQLKGILERNIRRQASPADAAALSQADSQWSHMKLLERPVATSANEAGHIPLGRLQGDLAAHTGNKNARMPVMETIATAGKSWLRPPKSSGTAERTPLANLFSGTTLAGLVGGGTALTVGTPAAMIAATASLLIPPAVRGILQSRGITRMMIEEALHRGANPSALRRAINNALRDAKYTVPAALASKPEDEQRR
jgi:hypothetical protein